MIIQICCSDGCWEEIAPTVDLTSFRRVDHPDSFDPAADAFINLSGIDSRKTTAGKPYLIGSVWHTLDDLGLSGDVLRIGDWPGFLSNSCWEYAGIMNERIATVFTLLGKQPVQVSDQPGLVRFRIISMIINEAYFALEEEISTKAEMDTAMKYGTNYPLGPFEWAEKIGLRRVAALLQRLQLESGRYVPSELLLKEAGL